MRFGGASYITCVKPVSSSSYCVAASSRVRARSLFISSANFSLFQRSTCEGLSCRPHSPKMQTSAVEATIDAAEVALDELQRLFSVLAADEQQRLPPGIVARTARLAEIAGLLGETAGLLQAPVVAAHSGDDREASGPSPTGSGKGFASRVKTGVRTQGTRLTQRRHGSFSRRAPSASGPWEAPSVEESSDVAAAQFHAVFTGDAEPPDSCSSPPDAARSRARARARALGEAHGQTAELDQVESEEEEAEPEPPNSSSGRSGFASRIKTNVQMQGTRLNIRRQGSFSRMPVGRASADVDSNEGLSAVLSAEQAAVAFQAAFQADGARTARD